MRIVPSPNQLAVIKAPLAGRVFLSGPAGCGKTTAAVERLRALLSAGVPGETILMLTPQRTLQEPYLDLLYSPEREAGGEVTPATIGGLARRMCDLFWPLYSDGVGFAHPNQPPTFLTLETAQYFMAHLVRPLLDQGYFESVTIDRNRLYSQILDNLNKSAVVGFPHTEIGARLDSAFFGDPAQRRVYADAQDCASLFRQYCLDHNLLDFSLQLEIFTDILWPEAQVQGYLTRSYRHLIYDNVEEDGARAHDLVREWLPGLQSALLIYDEGGGHRYFLGADADTGRALSESCDTQVFLDESFVMSRAVARLDTLLAEVISQDPEIGRREPAGEDSETLNIISSKFYPELLDQITDQVESLISGEGIPPAEIVILAPYLSDALRFSLTNRLQARSIPWRSHRPSRSLREEPTSHALLTLAALAHPSWNVDLPKFDVAYALMQSIQDIDLVRAQLLTEIVYRPRDLSLSSFDKIMPDVRERVTYSFGNRYALLRDWLLAYREGDPLPLDHFMRRLFGEVLSQPGFGFHTKLDSVRVAASLVESIRKFRQTLEPASESQGLDDPAGLGREYLEMLQDGVLAAQYLEGWQNESVEAVLVAPAYTFLMMNRPAAVQFWLDIGSSGWYERLSQPLTHPYVLSRGWQPGRVWSDADEVQASRDSLARLVSGLLHRCREGVYLGLAELGESGFEQRGELLRAFQKVLQEQ